MEGEGLEFTRGVDADDKCVHLQLAEPLEGGEDGVICCPCRRVSVSDQPGLDVAGAHVIGAVRSSFDGRNRICALQIGEQIQGYDRGGWREFVLGYVLVGGVIACRFCIRGCLRFLVGECRHFTAHRDGRVDDDRSDGDARGSSRVAVGVF